MSEERLQALEARVEALVTACSVNAAAAVQLAAAHTQTVTSTMAVAKTAGHLVGLIEASRQTQTVMAASTAFLLDQAGVIKIAAFIRLIDHAISSAVDPTYLSFLRNLRNVLAAADTTQAAPIFTVIEGGLGGSPD